ncbi:carbonic anhydrase 14-like [Glandiceps talaboti]
MGAGWGYHEDNGPLTWEDSYPLCGGSRQSPIDIAHADVEEKDFDEFTFTGFGSAPPSGASMTLYNNGHAVQVNMVGDYLVSGGGLPSDYKAVQFHFHWGNDSTRGSEHLIDGNEYAAELHIVCYDYVNFASAGEAMADPSGLAVLGTLVQIGDTTNTAYAKLTDNLAEIHDKDEEYNITTPLNLMSLMPEDTSEFFRYEGSLTTPTCNESVIWTVMRNAVTITEEQMELFRNVNFGDGTPMVDTHRPPQPLNGRTVYIRSVDTGSGTMPTVSMALLIFSIIFSRLTWN